MFENYRVFKTMFAGRELTVETGKVCGLANGSCWVRYGETVVMVNVAASAKPRDGVDFFPLSVDYEEKLYAVGKIPGGEDGASHQCNEDIALMRSIPGMTVINPADDVEAKAAVLAMADYVGPTYMRFGRLAAPIFNDAATYKFEVGKGIQLKDGKDVTIIATGLMVSEALEAAKALKEQGVDARVINIHTIKPIDRDIIVKAAKETGRIITVEEHSVIGGLGSAVADVVTEECPVPVIKIGVKDVFGHSGPAVDLLKEFGLCAENIVAVTKAALGK